MSVWFVCYACGHTMIKYCPTLGKTLINRRVVLLRCVFILTATMSLSATAAPGCPVTPSYPKTPQGMRSHHNDIPPLLQWNANYGYCGEVSFISAGLYYGQYLSQYDARSLATPNVPQYQEQSQLLLGLTDGVASRNMHLDTITLYESDPEVFLSQLKNHVVRGFPVALAVMENNSIFQQENPDPQYDHVVPVVGIFSYHDLHDAAYFNDDKLVFSDNGLYTPKYPNVHPFYMQASFRNIIKSRTDANLATSPPYTLAERAGDYAIVFTGVTDLKHETVPVRVAINTNCERPAIINGTSRRPASMPLTLTITVSGLNHNSSYVLYEYDNMNNVPDMDFNTHADLARYRCSIPVHSGTTTFVTHQSIHSSQMAIFRAVQVSGKPVATPDCPSTLPSFHQQTP